MSDWTPEPRPIAPELANTKVHAIYSPKVEWVSMAEKLDSDITKQLLAMAKHVV